MPTRKYNYSGKFKGRKVPRLFRRWVTMRSRCYNPNFEKYKWYGARGIRVCNRWLDFHNFESDMLPTFKEGLTLERKDVNGDYSPENCYWATWSEQQNNKRNNHLVTWEGQEFTLSELARKLGFAPQVIFNRIISYGWSVERAFTTPVRKW